MTTPEAETAASGDGEDVGGGKSATPRLPRWTRHEILVLIEGKRVAESQARKGRAAAAAEPKWVVISSYCKRHGVNREAVQCRKRWSNLAGDFRKIREWESHAKEEEEGDSFWVMRNDLRRERKLPGFFDREIFDVLDRDNNITTTLAVVATVKEEADDEEEDEDAVFDSGRAAAAEDGLFSDFEQTKQQQQHDDDEDATMDDTPLPISERRYQPFHNPFFHQGGLNRKQADPEEKGEGQKRKRLSSDDDGGDSSLREQLVKVLESNNKMLAAQLEAQNVNSHLDRDQRKDQGDSLIGVLNKLADALGKIADKI